jgi:mono/diheme cytochrome c family protein
MAPMIAASLDTAVTRAVSRGCSDVGRGGMGGADRGRSHVMVHRWWLWCVATMLMLVASVGASAAAVQTAATQLELASQGRARVVTLAELKRKLRTATLTVKDASYDGRTKTYEGFWLEDVLALGGLDAASGDEIWFRCADGYTPTMPLASVRKHKGLVAFRDKGAPGGWEKIRQGKSLLSPAPYYLVWDSDEPAYPWPYQLVGIEIVTFREKFDRIFPAGEAPTSAVSRGFAHFREHCLRCHSLNLQGGEIGPELNVPKNVTEYWDEKVLVQFIRNPGEFRARSKMPPFPQLTDRDIEDLMSYLRWMRDRKRASAQVPQGVIDSVEVVQPRHVRVRDLPAVGLRHAIEDAFEDLTRPREGGLRVRVVRSPHQQIDADEVAVADAQAVLLEAQEDVAAEEVAGQHVAREAVPARSARALRVRVVEALDEVRRPRQLVLGRAHAQARMALEHAAEDEVREGHAHEVIRIGEHGGALVAQFFPLGAGAGTERVDVQAQRRVQVGRGGP